MTLTIPRRLPTLEPVRAALIAALTTDLAEALDAVERAMVAEGLPALDPPLPKAILARYVRSYSEVSVWPTLAVTTYALRPREESQQGAGTGQMRGTIECSVWLDAPAGSMDALLERYAVAIWLVAMNHDPLAHRSIAPDSLAISPDPSGGTGNRRAGVVTLDVLVGL